jgi:hypothetical protein
MVDGITELRNYGITELTEFGGRGELGRIDKMNGIGGGVGNDRNAAKADFKLDTMASVD